MGISHDYVNGDLYHHEKDGWSTQTKPMQSKNIHVEMKIPDYSDIPKELIEREIAYSLAKQIIENGLVSVYEHYSHEDFSKVFAVDMNVSPTGRQFTSMVTNQMFKVNGEEFSEDELIFAVKKTYPEKLI